MPIAGQVVTVKGTLTSGGSALVGFVQTFYFFDPGGFGTKFASDLSVGDPAVCSIAAGGDGVYIARLSLKAYATKYPGRPTVGTWRWFSKVVGTADGSVRSAPQTIEVSSDESPTGSS